ncbi:MAG TPA: uroporphyrinogen-III C-methyltransferase [Syntrophomonas sp.]|nr:uroporphyrinogen-III C-methyltransferase [Syntrophomonas sp.]HPT68674.1 uroporphyrinogen-III C-methyltransferase [Syntrophomonas sp.]
MEKKGFVYLVGAGPGDPGLFTIKGKELLERAEVVVYDRLVSPDIIAWANPQAELIYVGKESNRHTLSQDEINALLAEKAAQGKMVVRLKGGDPFVFGRGGEEALYVRERGFDFAVVPGISSAIAVPAYAGIPVTHRDATSSFAVITGHEKPGKEVSSINWKMISTGIGTLVFLMGVENLEYIVNNLMENGRSPETPVALIRRGTMSDQEVVSGRLDDIVVRVHEAGLKPPAIIVVGETVNLRRELGWWETGPLWGKRIVVTRSRHQASVLVQKIRELGGEAIEFPTIEIAEEENLDKLYQAFENIASNDWIIFTSVNAVDIFFRELKNQGHDIRSLAGIKIGAIGPATSARLHKYGLLIDLMPEEYLAEGIIKELQTIVVPGQRVLLPRARGARDILPLQLGNLGAEVEEIFLYQAVVPHSINRVNIEDLLAQKIDYITFTSSSTVANFVDIIGNQQAEMLSSRIKVACIGPITAEKAREMGLKVDIIASEFTIDGLLQSILADIADGI